jgi:hypothetical protein
MGSSAIARADFDRVARSLERLGNPRYVVRLGQQVQGEGAAHLAPGRNGKGPMIA